MKTVRFLALFMCICMLTALFVFADTQENQAKIVFSDIAEDAPYAKQVQKLVENGVLSGYEDGTFRPEGGVTRAEMCKMITLSFGLTDTEGAAGFTDMTQKDWFYPYALAAQKAGIVNGFEDGSFRGYEKITREQVCAILVRVLKPFDLPFSVTLNDKVSDWARPYVETILKNQLMKTDENGNFRATEVIKRHELATTVSVFVADPVEPITADVKFFVGETQHGQTQKVICGEFPVLPEAPAAPQGYKFDGWKIQGTQDVIEADFQRVFTDIIFEAVFVKQVYSVKFYDGETLMFDTVVSHGDAPSNPILANKDKNAFLGWSNMKGGKVLDLTVQKIIKDTNFYARFADDEVSSLGGGGAPPAPKPPKDEENEDDDDDNNQEDQPQEKYFDVRFFKDSAVYNEQKVIENGFAVKPTDPSKDGCDFDGWSTSRNGSIVDVEDYQITQNTDFYACFTENVPVQNPNSQTLMTNLTLAHSQLKSIRMSGNQKKATGYILDCIQKCIDEANNGKIITKAYIKSLCPEGETETYLDKAEDVVKSMGDDASAYYNLIASKTSDDVEIFLTDYFDIDVTKYLD